MSPWNDFGNHDIYIFFLIFIFINRRINFFWELLILKRPNLQDIEACKIRKQSNHIAEYLTDCLHFFSPLWLHFQPWRTRLSMNHEFWLTPLVIMILCNSLSYLSKEYQWNPRSCQHFQLQFQRLVVIICDLQIQVPQQQMVQIYHWLFCPTLVHESHQL